MGGLPFGLWRCERLTRAIMAVCLAALLAGGTLVALARNSAAQTSDAAQNGVFSDPTAEPSIGPGAGYPRVTTDNRCIDRSTGQPPTAPPGSLPQPGTTPGVPSVGTVPSLPPSGTQPVPPANPTGPGVTRGFIDCKPTAGSQSVLPAPGRADGKVVYWDNLAGTENVELSIVGEFGVVGLNDQTRLLNPTQLDAPTKAGREQAWHPDPAPVDGGAQNANKTAPLLPGKLFSTNQATDAGSLFCSGQLFLSDGRVLATGGTKYVNDPGNDQSKFGATELEGIPNSRIYNPHTNTWSQTGSMNYGRWYGTPVTMAGGKIMELSGLRKLVKAVNTVNPTPTQNDIPDPNRQGQPLGYSPGYGVSEGQNERNTEVYHPATGKWTANPDTARKSLPLFPRMHLLPDGHVYYDAGGQAFNPAGQAYDEALWNIASSYNPATQKWTDLGIPGTDAPGAVPGFIGSTFSVLMPLTQSANGRYNKAHFLVAGGVPNPPSPGGYFSIKQSAIHTVDTTGGTDKLSTKLTGPLATSGPFGRWYSSGTLLPDGSVLATSGADRDEVALPGFELPVRTAELFDPRTNTWRQAALQHQARTYHNTANLLPDGRVLIGGHAVISNGYLANRTLVPGVTAPNGPIGRDPTFEIYSPPYIFCPGQAATILNISPSDSRGRAQIQLDVPASSIKSVVTMRYGATTHLVDADQRSVDMKIIARQGNTLTVQGPTGSQASSVLPAGPYMTFVNRQLGGCVKPSHAFTEFATASGRMQMSAAKHAKRHAKRHTKRHRKHRSRRGRRHVSPRFTG